MQRAVVVAILMLMATGPLTRVSAEEEATQPKKSDTASAQTSPPPQPESNVARRLIRDVASDYRNFFSWENGAWLTVGGLTSVVAHAADQTLSDKAVGADTPTYPGALAYGSQTIQVPAAVVWWIAGHLAGSQRSSAAGRDLLRAQIAVFSWTNAIKWAADRTRPNGDPRGFPSGHASASFATAAVLQTHYGWKLGLPAYAAAVYTAASRVAANEHWLSDVTFGATVGLVCARTVTVRLRDQKFALTPMSVPGGAAIVLTTAGAN